jgi:hypothetical protein
MKNLCNICHICMSLTHVQWVDCGHHNRTRRGDKQKRPNAFDWAIVANKSKKFGLFFVDFVCCGMKWKYWCICRLRLKCDGTRAETIFRLSAKRTNPFKSAGASVQSTIGSRNVHISGRNTGYTMFRGSVKSTGYQLYSPFSPSLPLPFVTVCHHISTGLYQEFSFRR